VARKRRPREPAPNEDVDRMSPRTLSGTRRATGPFAPASASHRICLRECTRLVALLAESAEFILIEREISAKLGLFAFPFRPAAVAAADVARRKIESTPLVGLGDFGKAPLRRIMSNITSESWKSAIG
jgi:hypothetical protein